MDSQGNLFLPYLTESYPGEAAPLSNLYSNDEINIDTGVRLSVSVYTFFTALLQIQYCTVLILNSGK